VEEKCLETLPEYRELTRKKSAVSVVLCRFPNSITTTCRYVANKSATSWQLPRLRIGETHVMDLGA